MRTAVRLFRFREWARSSLVFVPGLITIGYIALSIGAVHLNDWVHDFVSGGQLFRGGIESARVMMATIATAAVTLTALVFSITMLVLQMTSTQYSPRVLRTFLRDVNSQVTLGIFVGTFAYTLSALRALQPTAQDQAPDLVMSVAILLAVIAVGAFVQYIDHIAKHIRIATIVTTIAEETRAVIGSRYSEEVAPTTACSMPIAADRVLLAASAGAVVAINEPGLVHLATHHDARLQLVARIGDFVPRGAPLLHIYGGQDLSERAVLDQITVGPDRTLTQDPAYGIRQLVDIASRALSPSTNDPTTAVQVLDQLHDLLRDLANRPLGTRRYRADDGEVRLEVPERDWSDYLDLALNEIICYGTEHIQVERRIDELLRDLASVTSAAAQRVSRAQTGARRATSTSSCAHRGTDAVTRPRAHRGRSIVTQLLRDGRPCMTPE